MPDRGRDPEKPGWRLDFRLPSGPGKPQREYSFSPGKREEFPRLDEPEEPRGRGSRVNGAWGWIPLAVLVLFFVALGLGPQTPEVEGEDESSDLIVGLVLLGILLTGFIAGSIAAFRGNRRGLTWTLPGTAIFLVIALVAAFDSEAEGGSPAAAAGVALGAAGLHVAAAFISKPQPPPDGGQPFI